MSTSENPQNFPTAEELCIKRPLYAPFTIANNATNEKKLYDFITSNLQMDVFCPWCAQPTVLIGGKQDIGVPYYAFQLADQTFEKKFICSRKDSHVFYFYFRLQSFILTKVGQSPSMADIEQGHIQHYRNILSKEQYTELSKSIGLSSHGVGIGSFVYLRRIFERLVEEAHQEAAKAGDWDDETYKKSRMDEKILLLKDFLPEFLVEQRSLYGIISLGIHALDEDTCLSHFPVIQTGIELILDQKLALDRQRRKMEEAKKKIGNLHQELKKA